VLEKQGAKYEELLDMFMLFEAKFEVVCRMVFAYILKLLERKMKARLELSVTHALCQPDHN
jgi:hypothetical protein